METCLTLSVGLIRLVYCWTRWKTIIFSIKCLIFLSQSLQPQPMYHYTMSAINQGKYPRTKGKCIINRFSVVSFVLIVFCCKVYRHILLIIFPLNRLSSSSTLWPWNCSTPNVASCSISCWCSPCSIAICSVLPSVQPTAVWPAAGPPGHDTLPWTGGSPIHNSLFKWIFLMVH